MCPQFGEVNKFLYLFFKFKTEKSNINSCGLRNAIYFYASYCDTVQVTIYLRKSRYFVLSLNVTHYMFSFLF